ncbi:MAG TPA: tetratricopeptide repeat protein [Bryobacteraceae bacterium]|nr:tetratricopeptide repeat protein [Bryobacteraceae bacterium]
MAWIVALSSYGRAQEQERMRTPAEMMAIMEADLQGSAESIYGSDRAAQWNALVNGTPIDKNQAIRDALQLPSPPRQPPVATGTVSVSSLRHTVPKPAVKDFQRAHKLATSGKLLDAAQALEKALALDPDFQEARENLGGLYLRLGRLAEAEPHLHRAIELDPSSSAAHSNLSAVQLLAGDLGAAERTARRALELSRDNDWARFVLGVTLLRNAATYSEALRHLESAARSVPAARETLNALQAK